MIIPEQLIANVQADLLVSYRRLYFGRGRTIKDARKLLASRHPSVRRWPAWREDAWAAVSALDQWRRLKADHAAGTLRAVTDDLPF